MRINLVGYRQVIDLLNIYIHRRYEFQDIKPIIIDILSNGVRSSCGHWKVEAFQDASVTQRTGTFLSMDTFRDLNSY